MKKLGKLGINPEKIMKNEELVTLKGGYDEGCGCFCYDFEWYFKGYIEDSTGVEDCAHDCAILNEPNSIFDEPC